MTPVVEKKVGLAKPTVVREHNINGTRYISLGQLQYFLRRLS